MIVSFRSIVICLSSQSEKFATCDLKVYEKEEKFRVAPVQYRN